MSARRGVLLVLVIILLAVMVSAGGLMLVFFSAGAPPSVPANSSLYLKIRAPFAEVEAANIFRQLFETPLTLRAFLDEIKRAKSDSRIKTLVVRPEANGALWAQLQEIRSALTDFRKSGKPVVAYLEFGGAQEYYVASAADRVVLMPAGGLSVSGAVSYELFFRGTLDKIGVFPDLLHIGDYKSASNTFTEKGFTPAHREMTRSLNHDWYDQLIQAVAEGRKRSPAEVKTVIEDGPYLAEGAKRAGLVDVLAYEDQIADEPPVRGTRRLEGDAYERAPASIGSTGGRIALLYATGAIASGKSSLENEDGILGSDTFIEWLRKVRIDSSIRAIVVRIDSPGGSAVASDAIWREIQLARDVKPLIVSMGDVAASGGYYIAAPAHVIVAEPGTITGSIGVVAGKFVLKETLNKLGVNTDSVSEGRLAEIDSPFRPFSTEERARMQQALHSTYDLFLSRVAEGRHSTPEKIHEVAQGRVWTGRQAKQIGLVDELGGLDTAIQIATQRARLDPQQRVQLVVYPPKRSVFDLLANPFGSSLGLQVLVQRPEARVWQTVHSTLRLFRRGEPLALMPNIFWN